MNEDLNVVKEKVTQKESTKSNLLKISYGLGILWIMFSIHHLKNAFENWNGTNILFFPFTLIFGYLLADFASGVIHWTFDTWGSSKTPIIGEYVIKPFRQHHMRPTIMLRHNWIETNGIVVILTTIIYFIHFPIHYMIFSWLGFVSFHSSICIFVFSLTLSWTNEFHKWNHDPKPKHWIIETMRNYGIIQKRMDHRKHHHLPFMDNYCMTTSFINPILDGIGFWRFLENKIIEHLGWKTRQEDEEVKEKLYDPKKTEENWNSKESKQKETELEYEKESESESELKKETESELKKEM